MKHVATKLAQIDLLYKKFGADFFCKGVFGISLTEKTILQSFARATGYKKPKNAYCGLGGCYYEHLQKLANK